MLKFMFLGPLLVSPVIGVSGLAATDAAAQQAKRVPLKLHESEISFIRGDSFIAGRFTWEPLTRNHIWRETLTFAGGAMTFYELLPNYFFRMNAPIMFRMRWRNFGEMPKVYRKEACRSS